MNTKRTVLIVLSAVAAVSALILGSSTISSTGSVRFNAALNQSVGDVIETGGTLNLGSTKFCDSFDPAMSYDSWCGVILRTYSRNLVSYANKPGAESFVVVPDLLAQLPASSDGGTTWTMTLRPGLKWDDGKPVTTADVKYSIERLFDPVIVGTVSTDSLCLISACSSGQPDYKGPTKSGSLVAITAMTDSNLSIELRRPFPTLPNVLAMPQFGIVEKARAESLAKNKKTYASAPASSGPFTIEISQKTVKFARNKFWSQESDNLRIPKVASMNWTLRPTSAAVDKAVIDNEVDLRVDGGLTGTVAASSLKNPSINKYLDQVGTGTIDYLALVPTAKPLERTACREAIFYALNKTDLARIHGGKSTAGIATSMISAGIPGGDKSSNKYPSGKTSTGDLEKARNKLSICGYPDGFEIGMAYVDMGLGKRTYESVQRSLARVGIVVDPHEYSSFAEYFTSGVGNPENLQNSNIGLIAAAWSPEPGQSVTYWGPITDGRKIKLRSNLNYALVNDDRINAELDSLESGKGNVAKSNRAIDEMVMEKAAYVPFIFEQNVLYRGPLLSGVYIQRALGGRYDLVNVGVNRK